MFKVKDRLCGIVYQVLDVRYDEMYNKTYFFIWADDKWAWEDATLFVPPNYNEKSS